MKPDKFFNIKQKKDIVDAIIQAEKDTSGEIRVHLEGFCKGNVLDRAAYIFEKLNMHKTILRNGVLFYLSVNDHKFAILGDAGINAVVPANFWDEIKSIMLNDFKENRFAEGLTKGILMSGKVLKEHFPFNSGDVNELSDEISFGNK